MDVSALEPRQQIFFEVSEALSKQEKKQTPPQKTEGK
jgi:hypothetical protein